MKIKEKYEYAKKIMNEMVNKYRPMKGNTKSETFNMLLKIQEKMNQFDAKIIDGIIKKYGPMVNLEQPNKKLKMVFAL